MRLIASTKPVDGKRAVRLMTAWVVGDKLAADAVLHEVMHDRTGVPGLLFALTDIAVRLGEQATPDLAATLRRVLLDADADPEG